MITEKNDVRCVVFQLNFHKAGKIEYLVLFIVVFSWPVQSLSRYFAENQ